MNDLYILIDGNEVYKTTKMDGFFVINRDTGKEGLEKGVGVDVIKHLHNVAMVDIGEEEKFLVDTSCLNQVYYVDKFSFVDDDENSRITATDGATTVHVFVGIEGYEGEGVCDLEDVEEFDFAEMEKIASMRAYEDIKEELEMETIRRVFGGLYAFNLMNECNIPTFNLPQ